MQRGSDPDATMVENAAKSVSEAVATRRSVRDCLPDPVPESLLRRILTQAARAPSGGNLQPGHVVVLTGARLSRLIDRVSARAADCPRSEAAEYPIYPSPLGAPYRGRRFAVGEAMYAMLGIPREDRAARRAWFARNYRLFDAPIRATLLRRSGHGGGAVQRSRHVPADDHASPARGRL